MALGLFVFVLALTLTFTLLWLFADFLNHLLRLLLVDHFLVLALALALALFTLVLLWFLVFFLLACVRISWSVLAAWCIQSSLRKLEGIKPATGSPGSATSSGFRLAAIAAAYNGIK